MISTLIQSSTVNTDKSLTAKFVAALMVAVLIILPLASRAGSAFRDYPFAVRNIYKQQYQMGLFLKTNYDGGNIAANDIGAINYLADVNVLDLYGLGSIDILKAQREGHSISERIDNLTQSHNVEIVIIYKSWFEGNIPTEWKEVGRWKISNNVVCGSDTVSFYVPTPLQQAEAVANLSNFSDLLPSAVSQSGIYIIPQ